MPKIKLKGELDLDLRRLGLKPGDGLHATKCPISKTGAMYFQVYKTFIHECVVWPENYGVIEP